MNDIPDQYLGDGVYASFDGWAIQLDLRGQDSLVAPTIIVLERDVYEQLVKFELLQRT